MMKTAFVLFLSCLSCLSSFGQLNLLDQAFLSSTQTVPTANLGVWLKADGLSGLANNDPVSTWTDFSGNGRNYIGTTTTRPLYKTSQQNGLPGVDFDGTDDFLTGTTDPSVSTYSLYVTLKMKSNAGTPVPFRFGLDITFGTSDGYCAIINGGNRSFQYRIAAVPTTLADGAATTNWELWSVIADATPLTTFRVNRAAQALTSSNATFSNGAAMTNGIIGKFGTFGLPASVVIGELILYKGAHSTTQRDQIELYLKAKWGL
jgi:hypothetical protein